MRKRKLRYESLEARLAMAVVGPDPSFGTSGYVSTAFAENTSSGTTASDVAIQPDGKIVSAGQHTLLRMFVDGQLDSQFGGGGLVGLDFDCTSLTLQDDGKIVLVGSLNQTDTIIARYLSDGQLDASFGTSGIVSLDLSDDVEYASAVAVDWVGRIVFTADTSGPLTVGRLSNDGTLDPTFGDNGLLMRELAGRTSAQDLALQANGSIIVAGNNVTAQNLSVYRINPNGTLDGDFGVRGVAAFNFDLGPASYWEERGASVEIQADGRIVAMCQYDASWLCLVRLNSDGSLDTSFSGDGKLEFGTEFLTFVADMKIHTDGRIFAMSSMRTYAVLPNGTLDESFGFFPYRDLLAGGIPTDQAMALSPTGIMLVGHHTSWGGTEMLYHRGLFNGAMDTSFGERGKRQVVSGPSRDESSDSTLQANGKLLVVGRTNDIIGVVRHQTNGDLDSTFGQGGRQTISPLPGYFVHSVAAIEVTRNGQIIVAATFRKHDHTDANVFLVRLNTDGSVDTSFGEAGYLKIDLGASEYAADFLIQPDGKLIVGLNRFGTGWNAALVRCNSNGTLDTSFSRDGVVQMATNGSTFNKILLQPDGRILGGGNLSLGQRVPYSMLVRFMPNGAPDSSFGSNSIIIERRGTIDVVTDIDIAADGSIFATGGNMMIHKYSSTGVRDTSFQWAPPNMMIPFEFSSEIRSGYGMQLILQPDGYLMSGIFGDRSVILAFRSNGTFDERFNGSGKFIATSSTPGNVLINRMLLQADGKLIATGSITESTGKSSDTNFVTYRFYQNATPLTTTTIARNSAGQIEINDLWRHDDKWRFANTANSLIITDLSADRRVRFSVVGLPEVTGNDTKQIVIPLSLLQATGQPLIVNGQDGDDTFTFSDQFNAPIFGLSFRGGEGRDALVMTNQTVPINWVLSSATAGQVRPQGRTPMRFSGIDKLSGGTNVDYFRLVYDGSNDRLAIDAGGGLLDAMQLQADQDMKVTNNAWPGDSMTLTVGRERPQQFATRGLDKITIIAGAGDNRLDFSQSDWLMTVRAGAGNDVVSNSRAPSVTYGDAGDDIIFGNGSADKIFGGEGNDVIIGGWSNDQLYGESGNDILIGNYGGDSLYGGSGQDLLIGGFCSTIEAVDSSTLGRLVVNTWASSANFASRMQQLSVLGVGRNRFRLAVGSTVTNDDEVDSYFGQDDLDWYLVSGLNEINTSPPAVRDFQPGEAISS